MRTVLFTILAFFLAPNAIADTEPNNTWQNALPLPQDRTVAGTQSDEDWYVINATAGNRILIDLTFTHAEGNIDVGFYDDLGNVDFPQFPGTLIANSVTNGSDHEFVEHNIPVPDTYYIRVYGGEAPDPLGDQGNSYTLTWTEIGADDGFEENDSNAAPAAIAESTVAFGSKNDEDWYSIDVAPGGGGTRVIASLRFEANVDLDLELRDAGGTLLEPSMNGVGVNETINWDVGVFGTYHLSLVDANNTGDGYALTWAAVSPGGTVDFPVPDVINNVPVATANTVSTTEDAVYNFAAGDFTFTDSEGDSLVSATITNLSLGGGTLTYSGSTALTSGDTLTAAQLGTLVYTPPVNVTGVTGSPLTTFDFTVNDLMGDGTVSAQMDIDVTAAATIAPTGGGSSGSVSMVWLFALMLIGVARRVHR